MQALTLRFALWACAGARTSAKCWLAFVMLVSAGASHAQAPAALQPQEVGRFDARGIEIAHFLLPQPGGLIIEYFISRPEHPAPVILFIQCSGCTPVFSGLGTARRTSSVFSYITQPRQGKHAVMVVNKPFVPAAAVEDPGAANNCPASFNEYFTLENWVRDLDLAFDHAQHLPWVSHDGALVIGVSAGSTAASALARKNQQVSAVALLGATGSSQFFDLVVNAYQSSDNEDQTIKDLGELEKARQRIAAAPESATDFAWGHTYKRWASFLRASATDDLLKSQARIYLVSGMQDRNVPILSTERMALHTRIPKY